MDSIGHPGGILLRQASPRPWPRVTPPPAAPGGQVKMQERDRMGGTDGVRGRNGVREGTRSGVGRGCRLQGDPLRGSAVRPEPDAPARAPAGLGRRPGRRSVRADRAQAAVPAPVRRAAARAGDRRRRLPEPERLDPGSRRFGPPGHGVDPRRRVRERLRGRPRLRRGPLRARRRGLRDDQLPPRLRRLPPPGRRHPEPRAARPDRGPGVGAGEHRGVRRRSGPGDDLRRVGGRDERHDAAVDAHGRRACSGGRSRRAEPDITPCPPRRLES